MKFKVGDVIKSETKLRTVLEVNEDTYRLSTENSIFKISGIILSKNYIDKIYKLALKKIKDTKLARKMYPDAEIEGEYLIVKITQ